MADQAWQFGDALAALDHSDSDRRRNVLPVGRSRLAGLGARLAPQDLRAIESFDQSSFKASYLLIGVSCVALALLVLMTCFMVLLGGR